MSPNQVMDHLLTPISAGGHGMNDYILVPKEHSSLDVIHMRDHHEDNGWLEHSYH